MDKNNKKRKKKKNNLSSNNNLVPSTSNTNPLEEYGIEYELVNVDPNAHVKNGYTLLPKETLSKISVVFQLIPGMAVNQVTISAANEGAKIMLEDAYKVIIKDGMHLANSKSN